MSVTTSRNRPVGFAVWLIIAGVIGWWAAFQLTVEKLYVLANPDATASCDFSLLVQCTANLDSPQGSVFGFPNPLIGLAAWVAPIVVGLALLAGARFANWFWWCFALGMLGGLAFVIWLIVQSIFVLGTLCPWCMVTWSVMIPTSYAVLIHLVRVGAVPASPNMRRRAERLMGWIPLLAVLSFVIIAIFAQVRLDVIGNLF